MADSENTFTHHYPYSRPIRLEYDEFSASPAGNWHLVLSSGWERDTRMDAQHTLSFSIISHPTHVPAAQYDMQKQGHLLCTIGQDVRHRSIFDCVLIGTMYCFVIADVGTW